MTKMPTRGDHQGWPIHDLQPLDRIERTVKPAIDAVLALDDLKSLVVYAGDITKPPEARLLAGAKITAAFDETVDERRERPNIDRARAKALTAGLDSLQWADTHHYCSLLDACRRGPGTPPPEKREVSLDKMAFHPPSEKF